MSGYIDQTARSIESMCVVTYRQYHGCWCPSDTLGLKLWHWRSSLRIFRPNTIRINSLRTQTRIFRANLVITMVADVMALASSEHQSHDIEYTDYMGPRLPQGGISSTRTIAILGNGRNNKAKCCFIRRPATYNSNNKLKYKWHDMTK